MTPRHRGLQFVWWWRHWEWGLRPCGGALGLIYRWVLCLGPLEIRRWR